MTSTTGPTQSTVTYRTVGELKLEADLYLPPDRDGCPIVVWVHGGALIFGHRQDVPDWLRSTCLEEGIALASIDYRLAPATKLPEIVEDVEEAIAWLGAPGTVSPNPGPMAVVGESAGGYLALTAAFRSDPRPDAVVSCWGYGDLLADWYTLPSPQPVHHLIEMTEQEARRQVAGPPVADDRQRQGNSYAFYQYCRQHGVWPQEVGGWNPDSDAGRFHPYLPVKNVDKAFPPTLLIHGTEDTDVPFTESLKMVDQLRQHGIAHQILAVDGAEHGLDGVDDSVVADVMGQASAFLRRHLRIR
jgi:acetyl esterase/lipase